MGKYKITIAEAKTYKQFVCEVSARSESEARKKAKQDFNFHFPEYRFHSKIIMCNKILY